MLLTILLFLPVMACAFGMIMHSVLAYRTHAYWYIMALFAICGLYCLSDAVYSNPEAPYSMLTGYILLKLLIAPCILPMAWMYLKKLRCPDWHYSTRHTIWIVFPVALFTAGAMLVFLTPEEHLVNLMQIIDTEGYKDALSAYEGTTEYYYYVVTSVIFRVLMVAEALFILIQYIRAFRREKYSFGNVVNYYRGRKVRVCEFQSFNSILPCAILFAKIMVAKSLENAHVWLPVTMDILLLICILQLTYVGLFASKKTICARDVKNAFRYNFNAKNKAEVVEEMIAEMVDEAEEEALKRIQEKIGVNLHIDKFKSEEKTEETHTIAENIFSAVADSWDEDSLLSRFQSLMVNEQLFLNPRLSLNDVAEKLQTNKTYVSKLVNNTYNLGFPELINTLRVDYAEQYILKNKNARQEEIAKACGFLSASSFNITFKKVTGMTPKVWVASVEKKNKK